MSEISLPEPVALIAGGAVIFNLCEVELSDREPIEMDILDELFFDNDE